MEDVDIETISETENFSVVRSRDEDGFVYHIEMGGVSLHLMPDEWEEFVILIKSAD